LAPGAPLPSIPVDLWYPAAEKAADRHAPPAVVRRSGRRTRAAPLADAPPAETGSPLPLIFYAPGWSGPRFDNTFLLANLASQGYVVAAIDDIGWHSPKAEPGSLIAELADFELTSAQARDRSLEAANLRLELMTSLVSAALSGLADADRAGALGQLAGKVDLTRAGMIGFSYGGAVAAEITLTDARFVAAANMDGWLFGKASTRDIERPYLVFNSDAASLETDLTSARLARRYTAELTRADRRRQMEQARRTDTKALLFLAVDHGDFTDDLFTPSVTALVKRWRRTEHDRLRLRAIIDAYVVAFFDQHLRGRPATPLMSESPPSAAGVVDARNARGAFGVP
jgi:dienelactone hydrolase